MNKLEQRYQAWSAAARVVNEATLATEEERGALKEAYAAFSEAYSASVVNMNIQLPTRKDCEFMLALLSGVLHKKKTHHSSASVPCRIYPHHSRASAE